MPDWFLILLVFAAVHRLTRLAIMDEIPMVKTPRDWAVNHLDPIPGTGRKPVWGRPGKSLAYLLGCPWCMSVWVGGVVVWLTVWLHPAGLPVPWLVWAASSSVSGVVTGVWESLQEQRWKLNESRLRVAARDEAKFR